MLQIGRQDDVLAHQRAMNSSRYVPTQSALVRKVSEENRVYLFNVGPWQHVRELGSAGKWIIPACPEGRRFSDPLVIDGLVSEPYPTNEFKMDLLPLSGEPGQLSGEGSGEQFAMQVLGEGPHISRASSFRPFGVFLSHSEAPAEADLLKAEQALNGKYLELVRMASDAYAMGPAKAAETIQPDYHFRAARALKKTAAECPWLANTAMPVEQRNCPNCGTQYSVGIAQCAMCKNILDEERYLANEHKQREIKRKLGKGKSLPEED